MKTLELPKYLRVHVHKSPRNGQWRWRMRAPNGAIIAASTEAYTHRRHCFENCQVVTGFKLRAPVGSTRTAFTYSVVKPLWRGREAT
jgi:uncharacterized protein YegP (UPF0339 family)